MQDAVKEIEFHVAGLGASGREEAVRRVVLALDAQARISFEPAHDLVRVESRSQTLEVLDALIKAGLEPSAATG